MKKGNLHQTTKETFLLSFFKILLVLSDTKAEGVLSFNCDHIFFQKLPPEVKER